MVQTYTYDSFFSLFVTVFPCGQTTYTYDGSIIIIRSQAQGCLITKNPVQCQAMHMMCALRSPHVVQGCMLAGGMLFLLSLLLLFVIVYSFSKLLFTFERGQGVLFYPHDAFPSHGGKTHLRVSQSQVTELRLGNTLPASNSRKGVEGRVGSPWIRLGRGLS